MRESWVRSLGWEDSLEEGKAAHCSVLAWRIPWSVQPMGSQRVGHDWATFTSCHPREQRQHAGPPDRTYIRKSCGWWYGHRRLTSTKCLSGDHAAKPWTEYDLRTPDAVQACSTPLYRRERHLPVGLSWGLNTRKCQVQLLVERVVTITLNINSFKLRPLCELTLNWNSGSEEIRGSSKVTQ